MRMRARTITTLVALTAAVTLVPVASAEATVPGWPTLSKGDSGRDVLSLQYMLVGQGYASQALTGTYDDGTVHTVEAYQSAHDLTIDGVAGKYTLGSLARTNMLGQGRAYVRACESQIGTERNGRWEPADSDPWKALENSFGMTADGNCDKTSFRGAMGRRGGE